MIYVIAIAVVVIVVVVAWFAYEFVTAPYLCDMCGRPSETALCDECRAEYERIMGVDESVVIIDGEWNFIDMLCVNCGDYNIVSDQYHWPRCPECGYIPARVRIEPQPEIDDVGYWWYEGEPYFDNDQMESHLFHDVFGNSEIDVDMKPILDGGVWYWERDDVDELPMFGGDV